MGGLQVLDVQVWVLQGKPGQGVNCLHAMLAWSSASYVGRGKLRKTHMISSSLESSPAPFNMPLPPDM